MRKSVLLDYLMTHIDTFYGNQLCIKVNDKQVIKAITKIITKKGGK